MIDFLIRRLKATYIVTSYYYFKPFISYNSCWSAYIPWVQLKISWHNTIKLSIEITSRRPQRDNVFSLALHIPLR